MENSTPFTPAMRKVFESHLPKAAAVTREPDIAVLRALLDLEDSNGTRMIVELLRPNMPVDLLKRIAAREEGSLSRLRRLLRRRSSSDVFQNAYAYLWKAKEESVLLGHTWVGTEHLALALISDSGRPVCQELASFGITPEKAKEWSRAFLESYSE